MKKGLFIFYDASKTMEHPKQSGIFRKISAQVKALGKEGETECELLVIPRPDCGRILLFAKYLFSDQYAPYYDRIKDCDFIYIRRFLPTNVGLIKLLRKLKKNTNVKVFFEFPTFPYDQEHKTGVMKVLLVIDKLFRNRLKKYVDHAVVIGSFKDPFGMKSINIPNGIDCSSIKVSEGKFTDDAYHLIAVANFMFYHGYERLIKGIKEYNAGNPAKSVVLHLVGPRTEECVKYEQLIKEEHLEESVIIHGPAFGEELDAYYDGAHMGVASLARKEFKIFSDLKSREYMARGIPLMSASIVDVAQEDDFALYVPNDDSVIDVAAVVNFLDSLYNAYGKSDLSEHIRTAAEERCDMSVTMAPVLDAILND